MDNQFLRIFNLYKNDIYRLAYSITKNTYDTDDIVQTVFIKLYNNKIINKDDKEIKRWLIKVTINECKTIFLSSWKRRIVSLTEKHENIKYEKDNDNLLNEINKLSKKERIVIFLYYYEGYKDYGR